jgi:glycosyltransferase involved in cell wall biosynthesis
MLVSILIPCYNAERWIAQAIDSALAQTWPEKEVIVVDDGSTDRSLQIIRGFDGKIRWETGLNRGANVARNRLLELARGEWLQYLDADDYLLPDKIGRQMEFLAGHADIDIVFGPVTMEYWNEGNPHCGLLPIPQPHDPWILLARWYLPQTGAALWRKQAIVDVGGWKPEQSCCQEHELYLRMLIAEKRFAYCEHNGAVYRHWNETTLWRGNVPEVHRRRLEIEECAERLLLSSNSLTPARRYAINMARFETARTAWQYDRAFAQQIMKTVRASDTNFVPGGEAAPQLYRNVYRLFGFSGAERIADARRTWFGGGSGKKAATAA